MHSMSQYLIRGQDFRQFQVIWLELREIMKKFTYHMQLTQKALKLLFHAQIFKINQAGFRLNSMELIQLP